MVTFLQIITTSVSHKVITEPNNFWWEFSKDFLLPISLGALAAYMAYYIFIKETKREKDLEDRRKLQERIDKLTFFSALVENGLQTSLIQTKNLKKQIRDITKDPIEFHLMTHVPLYDLKRITEVLNLEEYLLAYTNFYNEGRNISTREFKYRFLTMLTHHSCSC